jgi:hypothetical protein
MKKVHQFDFDTDRLVISDPLSDSKKGIINLFSHITDRKNDETDIKEESTELITF